jgi:hypothetical protein
LYGQWVAEDMPKGKALCFKIGHLK